MESFEVATTGVVTAGCAYCPRILASATMADPYVDAFAVPSAWIRRCSAVLRSGIFSTSSLASGLPNCRCVSVEIVCRGSDIILNAITNSEFVMRARGLGRKLPDIREHFHWEKGRHTRLEKYGGPVWS